MYVIIANEFHVQILRLYQLLYDILTEVVIKDIILKTIVDIAVLNTQFMLTSLGQLATLAMLLSLIIFQPTSLKQKLIGTLSLSCRAYTQLNTLPSSICHPYCVSCSFTCSVLWHLKQTWIGID